MRGLLNAIVLSLLVSAPVLAAEAWVEVSETGDRILVDQNSIQRTDDQVRYWEYRDVQQARNSELAGDQPVYGMMIYRSVNCSSRQSRMQRLVLFNQNREVIRRINYEENGASPQPMNGSSSEAAIEYVCKQQT